MIIILNDASMIRRILVSSLITKNVCKNLVASNEKH